MKHLLPRRIQRRARLLGYALLSSIGAAGNFTGHSPRLRGYHPTIPLPLRTVPLHASGGTHHVHVYVGSPPQRQTLIVDTGSRLMAFPCQPCRACGTHVSKFFNPQLSTTDRRPACGACLLPGVSTCSTFNTDCIITQKYTEGSSWTAHEIEDLVWLGSERKEPSYEDYMKLAVPYAFGCQTSEQGLFQKQYADGILGLSIHQSSFVQALADSNSIPRNSFSLCMNREGGTLSLGGAKSEPDMSYTDIARKHGWYAVEVTELKLNDHCVACTNSTELLPFHMGKGSIIDSGTTDTYLPKKIAPQFEQAWNLMTGMKYAERKRSYTYAEFELLPKIHLLFRGGANLTIFPENYMEGIPKIVPWSSRVQLVNRVYVDEPEGAVLGANAMMGHELYFDTQGNRVGIARSACVDEAKASNQ
jgi:hypothetical protein